MSYKVIVADDSQTIQKVINITLAKQPYDLIECLSEEALFKELEKLKPELVCLDFNLSDKFSGPELCERIRQKSPSTQVLFLLGTFDSVDDATMEKCGAADKIVKPFDSNKFISLCKRLTYTEPGVANPPQETSPFDDIDSQWTVSDTVEKAEMPQAFPEIINAPAADMNALDKEMSDWGMSIPGVINEKEAGPQVDLPPVIQFPSTSVQSKKEAHFPESSDLEYPTLGASTPSDEDLEYPQMETGKEKKTSSKLVSLDSFNEFAEEIELEGNYVSDESDVKELEKLISDEVEGDLWQIDEFEDLKKEVSEKIEELPQLSDEFMKNADDLFPRLDQHDSIRELKFEETPIPAASVDKAEIEEMVKKYVKQYLDEMFASKIEKIAWDMIPDLAENLIKSELKKISNKVLQEED